MAITFECPHPSCQAKLSIPNSKAGAVVICPHCKGRLEAPKFVDDVLPESSPPLDDDESLDAPVNADNASTWKIGVSVLAVLGALAVLVGFIVWAGSADPRPGNNAGADRQAGQVRPPAVDGGEDITLAELAVHLRDAGAVDRVDSIAEGGFAALGSMFGSAFLGTKVQYIGSATLERGKESVVLTEYESPAHAEIAIGDLDRVWDEIAKKMNADLQARNNPIPSPLVMRYGRFLVSTTDRASLVAVRSELP